MTESELMLLCAEVSAMWPHSTLPHATVAHWYDLLGEQDADQVRAVLKEYAIEGNQFPPTAGMVLSRLADGTDKPPEWDQAVVEIRRLIQRFGSYRQPPAEAWSHPVLARFMEPSWKEWCMSADGDTTFLAQQRNAYQAHRDRAQRTRNLELVGVVSLPALKRVPDALPELEGGSNVA